jgi:hypothetical protein
MKNGFSREVRYGRAVSSFSNGVTNVTQTGPGEWLFTRLSNVSSTKNPRPWNARNIAPHSYQKISYVNGAMTSSISGFNGAYAYSFQRTDFGIFSRGLSCYFEFPILHYNEAICQDNALQKLLDKVRGDHANLAVDVAEGKATLSMLRNAVKFRKHLKDFLTQVVTQRGYKKIRKGPSQGQRRLDYINGKWLEGRYGWMPFLSSIWSIVDARLKQRVLKETYLKSRSTQYQSATTKTGDGSPENFYEILKVDGSYRCEIGAFFELPTGFDLSDWTSLNPLSIAWELTTLSFVYEWFVGVGQYLENMENYALYHNRFRGGYMLSSYREVRELKISWYKQYPVLHWPNGQFMEGMWQQTGNQSVVAVYTQYNRSLLTSLPIPGGPRVKIGLNPKRLLDSAALIGQYVRKFR